MGPRCHDNIMYNFRHYCDCATTLLYNKTNHTQKQSFGNYMNNVYNAQVIR